MQRYTSINLALLLGIFLFAFNGSAAAERLHELSAEFLRLDSNRVYLWIDEPVTVNSDFTIEIQSAGSAPYFAKVSATLGRVVVSSSLSPDIVQSFEARNKHTFKLYLESDQLCDSLIIAMPSNLRELWLDTLFTVGVKPQTRYLFRYYDDMKEIEIAAKLQQIDLMIAPEFELPGSPRFSDCPAEIEWHLLCSSIKDDLLATALNNCIRGILAGSNDSAYSSLINQHDLESIFPRNATHARELFAQSRKNKERFECYFPGFQMYPGLFGVINRSLDSCGGRDFTFRDSRDQPLQLAMTFVGNHDDLTSECKSAIRELAEPIRKILSVQRGSTIDSCLLGLQQTDSCHESLSRALAESVRIVPLGRTSLALKSFEHVRWLDRHTGTAALSDFYKVGQ